MVKPSDTYMVMGLCCSFVTPGVLVFFYVTLFCVPTALYIPWVKKPRSLQKPKSFTVPTVMRERVKQMEKLLRVLGFG